MSELTPNTQVVDDEKIKKLLKQKEAFKKYQKEYKKKKASEMRDFMETVKTKIFNLEEETKKINSQNNILQTQITKFSKVVSLLSKSQN